MLPDIAEHVEALIAEIGRTATSFDIMRQSQQQGWAKPDSVDEWPTLWNKVKDDFPVSAMTSRIDFEIF